jgi:dienelactone hydrolase
VKLCRRDGQVLRSCLTVAGLFLAALLVSGSGGGAADAYSNVAFASASIPPTKFHIRRAEAQGIELKTKPGTPITGRLRIPDGEGPFPGLVLLHDCQGIRAYQDDWAETFTAWGYVTLQVDSFGPRSVAGTCTNVLAEGLSGLGGSRVMDAFGALFYLNEHPKVQAGNIGLVGWSRSSTTGAGLKDGSGQFFDRGFEAIVSFYPNCNSIASAAFRVPILMLVAGDDDWTQPELCRRLASDEPNVEIELFPGTLHGFDDPAMGERAVMANFQNTLKDPTFGVTFGCDQDAHDKALELVRAYLTDYLGP